MQRFSINDAAVIKGAKSTNWMIFCNLLSLVERPSCREDFKFLHILLPATVYPTQISNPQMKRCMYEKKRQNFLLFNKTSKLNVSIIAVKRAVMPSKAQMFWSFGAASDVFVVSSSMRSSMLNADSIKAVDRQSTIRDAANISFGASSSTFGLQSKATTFIVAAINNWKVVNRT